MGQEHLDGYLTHPQAKIKAICDINPQVLKQVGDRYGVEARYTSYEEMLDREPLDVVSIVTPNCFHKAMTEQALERGIHVLCEKPLGLNAEEAIAINQKSQEVGKRLMVNYSYRFKPRAVAIKKQIEAGTIGDIYSASCLWLRNKNGFSQITPWFSQKEMSGGGCLIDIGIHCLDKALWLMDFPEPKSLLSTTHNEMCKLAARESGLAFEVEDTVEAFIKFANNASLILQVSWAANIPERNRIEFKLLGDKAGIFEKNIKEAYEFEAETFYESQGISYHLTIEDVNEQLVPTSMYHFIEAIINDKPHMADGKEAVKAMQIIDAIYQSAQTGQPVTF
jgi:predicted dehydrogenase